VGCPATDWQPLGGDHGGTGEVQLALAKSILPWIVENICTEN